MSIVSEALERAGRLHEATSLECRAVAASGLRAGGAGGGLGGAVAGSPAVTAGLSFGRYTQTSAHQADQYGFFTGYPYAIINNIANRLAAQPIRVAKILPRGERARRRYAVKSKSFLPKNLQDISSRLEVYPTHAITDAIDNPNPIMVRHTLLYSTIASGEITGRGHWWMNQNPETGRLEIWPVPSHWIEPHHEPDRLFAWYRVTLPGTGEPINVPTRQIVPFLFPDPSDPFAVLSPLQANARSVMSDFAIELAQRMSFENGVNPGLAIIVGKPPEFAGVAGDQMVLTKEQRDQIIGAVRRQYRGVTRFDEPLILDALIRDVKPITTSPREMAFRDSQPLVRGRLTQGWGMNPIVLGEMENVNYASSGVADHHVCRNVFGPRVEMASQTMTCYIPPYALGRPGGSEGGIVIYMEKVTPEDPEMELKRDYEDYDRGIISRNDLRRKRGMEPIPGGDFAFIQGNQDQGGGWVQVDPDAEPDVDDDGVDKPVIYIPPNPNRPGSEGELSSGDDDEDDEDDDFTPADRSRRRASRRKVRDDQGHDHDEGGRFTGPGGSGHGGSDADRHDTGRVDDHPDDHRERARGLAAAIKKSGKKAVRAAKAVGGKAKEVAYKLTNSGLVVNDVLDDVYDYAKLINAKGTGDWLSTHLGVGGNTAALVASHVLAYGIVKVKQYLRSRTGKGRKRKPPTRGRRKGDDERYAVTADVLRTFLHHLGCPEEQLPTARDVHEWVDDGRPGGKSLHLGGSPARIREWVRAASLAVDQLQDDAEAEWREALAGVFASLGARAAVRVRDYCAHGHVVSPAEAAENAVVRSDWERELGTALFALLESAAARGAAAEWHLYRLSRGVRGRKSAPAGGEPPRPPAAPRGVLEAARRVAQDILDRGPVRVIVDGIVGLVRNLFRRGLKAGDRGPELADRVTAGALVGAAPARHADGVSRNEAAAAVNGGQAAVRDRLAKQGKVAVSEWVTREDERVRPAHRAMHGVRVRPGRAFKMDGHHCYYPGDPSLPPELRMRCRCKCVTLYTEGA